MEQERLNYPSEFPLPSHNLKNVNFGLQVSGGTVNNYNQAPTRTLFDVFYPHFVPNARYDSAQRQLEHATICQPETRDKILHDVRSWADGSPTTPICWLSGPAGTGKTTVAHTIAHEYDNHGRLAATFFFWRKTGDRDDIRNVVATLAQQIAERIPSAKERMEEALMLNDSSMDPLSNLSLQAQLSKLLVPNINPAAPNLVIIDGLDECSSRDGVCQLIEWIRKNRSPFRFLLTSRPDLDIEARFTVPLADGYSDVWTLSLTESEEDVRTYFSKELERIRSKLMRVEGHPSQWPLESDFKQLVAKSEGLFVYAATAIRYIDGRSSPKKLLENVLRLHKGLDNLYFQVIEEAKEWEHFDIVMGSLIYLRSPLAINDLSRIMLAFDEHLTGTGTYCALGGCQSILIIPEDNTPIEPYHASLRDFLTDQSRSMAFFRAPATCHGRLMFGCLSAITRAINNEKQAPEYALITWYYHACCFLSATHVGGELEEQDDETQELFKKIDVNWVKWWMIEALSYAGVPYLRAELPPSKVGN